MNNRYSSRPNRNICWGDKLQAFGINYGLPPRMKRQRTFFRHLPSSTDMIFAFGKYKSGTVSRTDDTNYMQWILGRFKLNEYQRMVLETKVSLDLKQNLANLHKKPKNSEPVSFEPTMKRLTFAVAVLDVVCDFANRNEDFTAYDVTREMRKRVNAGSLQVLDGSPTQIGGQLTTEVLHFDRSGKKGVRDIVHDIMAHGDVEGYKAVPTPNFVVYTFEKPNLLASLINSKPSTTAPLAQVAKVPKSRLAERIDTYIRGASARGLKPTLKQVQSAVRRDGNYYCDRLLSEVTTLGFRVNKARELSKSTVSL